MRRGVASAAVLAFVLLGLAPASALANNDNVADAQQIAYGVPASSNATAFTTEPAEPHIFGTAPNCGSSSAKFARTAWYKVKGTGGALSFSTAGSTTSGTTFTNDTMLAVYSGTPGSLVELGCNDDATGGVRTSQVDLASSPQSGQLWIQAGIFCIDAGSCADATAPTGAFVLTATNPEAPANDNRAQATALVAGVEASANNSRASVEVGEATTCTTPTGGHPPFGATLWFRFHAAFFGHVALRTNVAGTVDTVMAVYKSGSTTSIACNDDGSIIGASSVELNVAPGDYLVQVGSFGGPVPTKQGAFGVNFTFTANHDVDGDGSQALPFGPDCNDFNAKINPSATDIPQNGVDENCDGKDADFPKLKADSSMGVLFFAKYTLVKTLGTTGVKGATIRVTCKTKKKGCKLKSKTLKGKKGKVSLVKYLKKAHLKKGAVVEVRMTKTGFLGVVVRFTIRIGNVAKKKTLCLRPGAKNPKPKC